MAVSGTINTTTTETSSGTVTAEVSTMHVSGTFTGFVTLEAAPTGTTDFVCVLNAATPTVVSINTPDTTMLYRFKSHIESGEADVYLGA